MHCSNVSEMVLYKKSAYAIDKDKVYNEPHVNTAVVISANPAYETVLSNEQHHDDIMMDSNPAYELSKKAEIKNVFIQSNPSYDISKAQENITEDQYGKVELLKVCIISTTFPCRGCYCKDGR